MNIFVVLIPVIIAITLVLIWFIIDRQRQQRNIVLLSKLDNLSIVDKQNEIKTKQNDDFSLKLIQAGINQKEYSEGKLAISIIGAVLMIALPIFFSIKVGIIGIVIGAILIIFGGKLYIFIEKAERVEKIDRDLGQFLDLINVILEAGGSLKNAFFQVSRRAHGILDEELLKEVAILEYEMTNYSTKKAYENLKKRVDSEDMDKIVDFLILSEETGIGVKNIFSTQSEEMRQEKFYKIKGKVNTLNMYLMLIIFVFVLPALGAFIVFPILAGNLQIGL